MNFGSFSYLLLTSLIKKLNWIVILGIIIAHLKPRTSTFYTKVLLYDSLPVQKKNIPTTLGYWYFNQLQLVNYSVWLKNITRSE